MSPRQQPRRIARELALLSLSQIKGSSDKLEQVELNNLVIAAIRTLSGEVQESLETAAAEVSRSQERLLASETRATNLKSAQTMVTEALELTQNAINRLAAMVEIPEMVQLSSQYEVREYALEIIQTVYRRQTEIEQELATVMVDWQLNRLPKIDRDILRIAVAEMIFLEVPQKVAINEAVEIAKRYSDEEGYRFINGVLRRVTERLKTEARR
ncbi:NusB antitermination factor [Gloeothece citriformis PCC 7424]|uniref:Transcription antitermination protein NusB n=1 Tax=Gloeothece citriformis (strain PCC 7424) TaxID=65393 RepID=NUSB_GLOC7|nr:transcription antitermination factor NusB [Gloeothece citriformis]B7KFR8.1 RecName: Full=Transcription antitermination protein NusB; AltName: Full=Antitermination factor NusB [Gloeothece citriformis PCC 7424]ACK73393.1 NusB antitermination factor [Gloeothece citriformis PCC 7424]